MRVRFWGTRGSVPTPGPSTVHYGGNTSCVEMRTERGTFFILDSGTGIRELGLHLAREGGEVKAHLFLSHTHWDHISGFPFFTPLFVERDPPNEVVIYGARDLDRTLKDVLAGQMHYTYFPVPLGDLRADINFIELEDDKGEIHVDDTVIRCHYLNHTSVCMGYRFEADGASVAYITDHEQYSQIEDELGRGSVYRSERKLIDFVRGVDLLIQDAQYTPSEYAARHGWGHGSIEYVTDVGVKAGVRKLALFHHEPTHSDDYLQDMEVEAQVRARAAGSPIEIFAAAEGQVISL